MQKKKEMILFLENMFERDYLKKINRIPNNKKFYTTTELVAIFSFFYENRQYTKLRNMFLESVITLETMVKLKDIFGEDLILYLMLLNKTPEIKNKDLYSLFSKTKLNSIKLELLSYTKNEKEKYERLINHIGERK